MTSIPQKIRKEIDADPTKDVCRFINFPGHICGGRITTEHALYFAGKKIQKAFALVRICASGHGVDEYQDYEGTIPKDAREWVALNQATGRELQEISKAVDYSRRLIYLNGKYGQYVPPKSVYQTIGK
jgi:hypothetical protein